MSQNKIQVVYRLGGIDADDGVDIFEIAPILMNFGDLVRNGSYILGYDQKIDVKIKPFREGSWITDFVFQQTTVHNLLNYFGTAEGADLLMLCAFLGINVKDGLVGVASVIRWTKGFVSKFRKNVEKETVTYISPDGAELEVSMGTHRLVQSPLIQNNYYNCIVAPFNKFPSTTNVSLEIDGSSQKFTTEDKLLFEQYAKTELLEDVEDNITTLSGVFLKPKRGSYSGEEKAYSFIMGDNTILWPVTIEDQDFIQKLIRGEIRLYSEDVLKVDLEIRQKKDLSNKMLSSYEIKKVLEYMQYKKPKQLELDSI